MKIKLSLKKYLKKILVVLLFLSKKKIYCVDKNKVYYITKKTDFLKTKKTTVPLRDIFSEPVQTCIFKSVFEVSFGVGNI